MHIADNVAINMFYLNCYINPSTHARVLVYAWVHVSPTRLRAFTYPEQLTRVMYERRRNDVAFCRPTRVDAFLTSFYQSNDKHLGRTAARAADRQLCTPQAQPGHDTVGSCQSDLSLRGDHVHGDGVHHATSVHTISQNLWMDAPPLHPSRWDTS